MQIELATPSRVQAVDARIIENVRAIPAVGAEPEVIDVRRGTVFEHADQFVSRAIETTLAGVALAPDQKVFPLGVERPSSSQQLGEVAPVGEDIMDRSV